MLVAACPSLSLPLDCASEEDAGPSSAPVSVSRSVSAMLRWTVEVRVTRPRVTRRELKEEKEEREKRDMVCGWWWWWSGARPRSSP